MGLLIRRHKFNQLEDSGRFCFPFSDRLWPVIGSLSNAFTLLQIKITLYWFAFLGGIRLGYQIFANHISSIGMPVSFDLIYCAPETLTRGTRDGSLNKRRSNFHFSQSIAYKKR